MKVCPHEDTIIAGKESPVRWCATFTLAKLRHYTRITHFRVELGSYIRLHVPTVKSRSEVLIPKYFMRKLLFK